MVLNTGKPAFSLPEISDGMEVHLTAAYLSPLAVRAQPSSTAAACKQWGRDAGYTILSQ